ncbi:MAG: hypothetical protein BGN96_08220 [Bacteroidales bacterium 45-6]|nr:MAG: hypothetical protein BGN96_08220 [Bacteroidales bacterium 45-6]
MRMNKTVRVVFIISVIVSLFLFLRTTDIRESIAQIERLNYHILLILISTFLAYILGALGWKYCIDSDTMPSLPRLFALRHICNVITIFNPSGAVAGEIYNADMLIQSGISREVAYKSVLLSRIMMIISQMILLLVVIGWFMSGHSQKMSDPLRNILYGTFVVFLIMAGLLTFLILKKGKNEHTGSFDKKWQHQAHRIRQMRSSLAKYIQNQPRKAALAFVFFTLHWIMGSLELYFIINALGYHIGIWDGLFLDTLIVVSKSAVAFIPGQIGAEELINKLALYLMKLNSAGLWLSVSILRRARQLFWSGIALLFYIGIRQGQKRAKLS